MTDMRPSTAKTTDPADDRGILAGAVYWLTVCGWNRYCSVMGLPGLKGDAHYKRRDIGILVLTLLAVFAMFAWTRWPQMRWILAGWATYRVLDLTSGNFALAFFDTIHEGDSAPLKSLPTKRIQRNLVLIVFLWIELMTLFTVLYLWVDRLDSCSFNLKCFSPTEAFFVSMTTMTTVGYGGIAPCKGPALVLATWQAMIAVIIFIVLFSSLVAWKGKPQECFPPAPQAGFRANYFGFPLMLGAILTASYFLDNWLAKP